MQPLTCSSTDCMEVLSSGIEQRDNLIFTQFMRISLDSLQEVLDVFLGWRSRAASLQRAIYCDRDGPGLAALLCSWQWSCSTYTQNLL